MPVVKGGMFQPRSEEHLKGRKQRVTQCCCQRRQYSGRTRRKVGKQGGVRASVALKPCVPPQESREEAKVIDTLRWVPRICQAVGTSSEGAAVHRVEGGEGGFVLMAAKQEVSSYTRTRDGCGRFESWWRVHVALDRDAPQSLTK